MFLFPPGYIIIEKLYEDNNSIIYRATRDTDGISVVIKILNREYPAQKEIADFRREYEVTRSLANLKFSIGVYDLLEYGNSLALVLEDFGAQSLKDLIASKPLILEFFLHISIKICQALQELHENGIIHKDVNPSNIVYNPETDQLKIIDFGISTILGKENSSYVPSGQLEGTIAYISPEQTGRMNRRVDWRTDFYFLGVTFYEMLLGVRPFESKDPLELIHAHIARKPVSPHEINPH